MGGRRVMAHDDGAPAGISRRGRLSFRTHALTHSRTFALLFRTPYRPVRDVPQALLERFRSGSVSAGSMITPVTAAGTRVTKA